MARDPFQGWLMRMTAREALLITLAVVGFFVYLRWDAKRDGKRELQLAQNAKNLKTLDSALKVERGKFTVDTVREFRRITSTITRLDTVAKSDTLRLTDTVKVTVEVVREAVATLNACRETVRSCGELRALEQRRADSLQSRVGLLERQKPTLLSRCGVSVGYGVTADASGQIRHGLTALGGCRVLP